MLHHSGTEHGFSPWSVTTIAPNTTTKKRKKKKASDPANKPSSLPSPGCEVCSQRQAGRLSPHRGRAPLPSQWGFWASFPWEPGPLGLRPVEERGVWDASKRNSESSLFSKPFPRGANPTPLCQTILQWNRVFDVMDWERGINWVPQRDNQEDSPAFEV